MVEDPVADALDHQLGGAIALHDVHTQGFRGGAAGNVPELEVGNIVEELDQFETGEFFFVIVEGVHDFQVGVDAGVCLRFPGPDGLDDLVDDQTEGGLNEQFDELGFLREIVLKETLLYAGGFADDGQWRFRIAGLSKELESDAGDALLLD